MITHFKGKFKGDGRPVNLCKQFAFEPVLGKTTSNPEEVTCKACAKALGVTPAKVDAPVSTSASGTCGICRGVQKLKNEKLVLHGYSRPGYGWIEGKCFGVGYRAWELSNESGVEYLKRLKRLIGEQARIVAEAKSATKVKAAVGDFKYQLYSLSKDNAELLGPEKLSYKDVEAMRIPQITSVTDTEYAFESAKQQNVRVAERSLAQMQEAQKQMEQAVANWTAQSLPGAALESNSYLADFRRMALGRRLPGLSEAKERVRVPGVGSVEVLKTHDFNSHYGDAISRIVSVDGVELEVSTIPYRLKADGTPAFYQTVIFTKDRETELVDTGVYDVENVDEANMASFKHLAKALEKLRSTKAESRLVEDDAEIAKTIAMQMAGGVGKLRLFLGAKPVAMPDGLKFSWPNKKRTLGNVCVVTLRPDDTYDMEFFNGTKSVKKFEGLYAEDLKRTFESHTGWYLSL